MAMIQVERVYSPSLPSAGSRFLVDRVWPRGVKRETLRIDAWLKEVAPSTALRQWFGHDPSKWHEFLRRYHAELDAKPEKWQPLQEAARNGDVTLLYGARDTEHNQAVALKQYLEAKLDRPPTGT